MQKIIFAGASVLFGLEKIREEFLNLNLDVLFFESPAIKKYFDFSAEQKIFFSTEIPSDAVVVPLGEFWISYCIKNGGCKISKRALDASRSKKIFYDLLSPFFRVPEIFSVNEAAQKILREEKKIIVKPEGLFSGYGIKIVDRENFSDLEKILFNAANIKNNATKLFQLKNSHALATEFFDGEEFSADVFFFCGKISVVRFCKKEIAVIHGTPCTAVCQILDCPDDVEKILFAWTKILFDESDISFAQFDFIKTAENFFVPVDFSCRIGGGMKELLENFLCNVYAESARKIFSSEKKIGGKNQQEKFLTQLNYLPTKSGIIFDDRYNLHPGKKYVFKKKGDFVPCCPSSASSRIASVVAECSMPVGKKIFDSLLIGAEKISFWKKS